jgi:GGDEF domain-containing protein
MSVLSLRKSVDELDQAAAYAAGFQRILARTIRTAAQYAVEVKSADYKDLGATLERVATEAEMASGSAQLEQLSSDTRAALRAYRDVAQAELDRIRKEASEVMNSVQGFMENVATANSDHEILMREEFKTLQTQAADGDIDSIRGAIQKTADAALQSCADIKSSSDMIIAQLQDEIRQLHLAVDKEHRAALSDPTTGVWNRAKLDGRIKDLILLNETFCIFLVGVPRLAEVGRTDPRVSAEFLRALAGRLDSFACKGGEKGMVGRWGEGAFAIIFNLPLAGAPTDQAGMMTALNTPYSVLIDGAAQDVATDIRVAAIERAQNAPETGFYMQLGQAAFGVTTF